MFNFLSYGLGNVLIGGATSLLICALLLFLSARSTKHGNLTPIALIAGGLLFCLLFYQLTSMFYAMQIKSTVMDTIDTLSMGLQALNLQPGEGKIRELIDEYPIIANFIDLSQINNIDWSDPVKSLQEIIGNRFNSYIYERLGWAAGFTVVLGAMMFLPDRSGTGRKRKGPRRGTSATGRHYGEDFY